MKPTAALHSLPRRLAVAMLLLLPLLATAACGLNPFRTDPQIKFYRGQLAQNAKDADALFNLGLRHFQLGKYLDALDAFEDRLTLTPEDPETLYYAALCYHKLGRLSDATELYRSLTLIDKPRADRLFKVLY